MKNFYLSLYGVAILTRTKNKYMKKIFLFLALMLPVLAFTACSDDDDSGSSYKLSLSGLWEEYPKNSESNTYLLLNTDKSGYQWVIDNEGRLTDQKPLTWTANKQYITLNFDDIGSLKIKYDLYGNILSLATGKTYKKI